MFRRYPLLCCLLAAAILPASAGEQHAISGVAENANPTVGGHPPAQQTRPLQFILDIANGLPAEISARVRIDIASGIRSQGGENVEASERLLEEAFYLAAEARFPVGLDAVNPQSPAMESVEGARAISMALPMDGASLQASAVERLANWNLERALRLMEAMPSVDAPSPGCGNFLAPIATAYPKLLAALIRKRRSLPEQASGKLVARARDSVSGMASLGEVAGLLELVESSGWAMEERDSLRELAAASVARLPTSAPRPWRQLEGAQRVVLSLENSGTGKNLREAWIGFLKRQEWAPGCEDSDDDPKRKAAAVRIRLMIDAVAGGIVVPLKNSVLSWSTSRNTIRIESAKGEVDGFQVRILFASKESQAIRSQQELLMQETGTLQRAAAERAKRTIRRLAASAEPVGRFQEFRDAFLRFRQQADIHDETAFHEICGLWQPVISAAPTERLQMEEAVAFAEYLDRTPIRQADPPSWYRYASHLANMAGKLEFGQGGEGRGLSATLPHTIVVLQARRMRGSPR
ncbi:MAG: hypothetical protein U5J83_12200 [Bryobacterales bacterium]|nr:hypothetical protein [Bryobacterales bacterium]